MKILDRTILGETRGALRLVFTNISSENIFENQTDQ